MITIEPPSTIPNSARSSLSLTRILTRACLALLIATAIPTAAQKSQSSNWQLTWSDEFNGPDGSSPDSAKWNIVTGGKGFGNNELETYTVRPDNVQQQNGNL